MANPNPTTTAQTFAESVTYKLRSWNELYSVQTKRYFHCPDGNGLRTVEITRDLRIACRCGQATVNLQQGLGPCEHTEQAIEYIDQVGWNRLPTWKVSK